MLSALSIAEALLKTTKAKFENGGTEKVVEINKIEFSNSEILVKALGDAVEMVKADVKENAKNTKGQITIISTCRLSLNGKSLQNKDVVKTPNNAETKRAIELGLIKIVG